LSYKKITLKDIYNYEVGDVYHFSTNYYTEAYSWYENQTKEVLEKEWINENSVKYRFRNEKWGYEGPPPFNNMFHIIDTNYNTYSDLDSIICEHPPFKPFFLDEIDEVLSFSIITTDNYNGRPSLCTTNNGYMSWNNDSCFYNWWFDSGTLTSTEYVSGCEILGNYFSFDYPTLYSFYNNVAYFNKQGEEWGTPLTPPTIGIQENQTEIQISLFPNPANEYFNIIAPDGLGINTINIYNQTGQLLLQIKSHEKTIDISSMKPGLYFIELKTDKGIFREKLIIQ